MTTKCKVVILAKEGGKEERGMLDWYLLQDNRGSATNLPKLVFID